MSVFCSRCEAELPEDDRFCEVCGAALPASPAAQETPPDPATLCPKCGAGPKEMDDEGFCSGCGFRREERGRDHLEVVVSPHFAGITDRGLRHHRNEDYLALRRLGETAILIVSDGVSSAQDPDVASATAAERALLAFEQTHRNGHATGEADVEAALTTAQESVASLPRGTVNAPATTIVIAVYTQGRAIIGWRGDSRAYWIGEDGATALTTDHSWLNEVIKSAEMTEAEAQNSPNAHAITNWLGADAPPELPASVQAFTPAGPGELLLCSDGLWNYASDPAILFELTRAVEGDALAVCRRLVEFARSKGGNDNITVAVLSVDGPAA